ncbi:hypothetical protein [Thermoflavimicrobium daqui]|uniref:Uncharacterized protein n=1 Tax=Thermoflavimicrobium daqui TaxID=2137476 RepID=A0A364K1B2_9BACL|nr:hypothetical protein [Thermoflavimicrobium daqui]RAL21482.1 hypothetical protein DL897_16125 [Thermoflavimicrobium daqui]
MDIFNQIIVYIWFGNLLCLGNFGLWIYYLEDIYGKQKSTKLLYFGLFLLNIVLMVISIKLTPPKPLLPILIMEGFSAAFAFPDQVYRLILTAIAMILGGIIKRLPRYLK